MSEQNSCEVNGITCLPISIPDIEQRECQENLTRSGEFCHNAISLASQECMGQMPCTTEEYTINVNPIWSAHGTSTKAVLREFLHDKVVDELLNGQHNKYFVWLGFYKDNKGTNGFYADWAEKYVHKEHLAWTGISMVGNIGGQLGLWVGFSFTSLAAGIFNVCNFLLRKFTQNQSLRH